MAPGSGNDIGMMHVGARYYDPSIGRFSMRDPIGIEGGINVYAYLRASPCQGVDPLGLSPTLDVTITAWANRLLATFGPSLPALQKVYDLADDALSEIAKRGPGRNTYYYEAMFCMREAASRAFELARYGYSPN